ncbi:MAG TPA: tetratricopeptide repeat protein [Candidatus Omnitrophota bacterium]|nr:tetratricopeptide repeat protein [Candidatus Omnitrophota bacterium]HPD84191.1 tetratricopeptide repeat protein [Candidatus Omnitrophota bacterium]HRZ03047.1 tetratricopeptide repeat protein [Candidatus Omnitrophota bacterium]
MKPDLNGTIYNLKFSKIVALLCALGFLAYANAIFHPFVHDDIVFIRDNPHIRDWGDIVSIFTRPWASGYDLTILNSYYRPLLEVLYKVQYFFFGINTSAYHLFNIVIHIVNSVLVYGLVILLADKKTLALCVALLFLLHPVQTEAVSYIAGISDLFFSLFCFSSFLLYILAHKRYEGKKAIGVSILSSVLYTLGLLSKEGAVLLLLVLIFYEFYFLRGSKEAKLAKYARLSAIFIITIGYFLYRKLILGGTVLDLGAAGQEFVLRIAAIPAKILAYLKIIIFPVGLHFYRCTDILAPFIVPSIILAAVVFAVILAVIFMDGDQRRWAIFGLGWFILTLMPVHAVPLTVEYSSIMSSEHFLYFPFFGFLIFSLAVLMHYGKRILKEKAAAAGQFLCILVIFVLTAVTIKQNTYWQSEIALFTRALQFEPKLGRVHILLARAYYLNGQVQDAVVEYQKALEIMQGYLKKVNAQEPRKFYLQFVKEIHSDLAHCHEAQKDLIGAIAEYKQALSIDPSDSLVHNNIGAAYFHLKDIHHAMEHFNQALAVNGTDVMAMNNLALCYIGKEDFDRAQYWLKRAIETDPRFQPARQNLEKLINSGKLR